MAEGGAGGEDLSKVSGGDGGKEDPDPKAQHTASAKSGKKVRHVIQRIWSTDNAMSERDESLSHNGEIIFKTGSQRWNTFMHTMGPL